MGVVEGNEGSGPSGRIVDCMNMIAWDDERHDRGQHGMARRLYDGMIIEKQAVARIPAMIIHSTCADLLACFT